MMIKGSCLCGGIRFEIDAVRSLTHCHCSNCRKLSGAAFASYVHVDADKFRLLSGEDLIEQFESAPGSFRALLPRMQLNCARESRLSHHGEYTCRTARR